jgi:hypothetical protein
MQIAPVYLPGAQKYRGRNMGRKLTSSEQLGNPVEFSAGSPALSMNRLKQNLMEMRKQARLHEHEALSACLTLAISLAAQEKSAS